MSYFPQKLPDNLQSIFTYNHVSKQTHIWRLCQKIEVKKSYIQPFEATILYDHLI